MIFCIIVVNVIDVSFIVSLVIRLMVMVLVNIVLKLGDEGEIVESWVKVVNSMSFMIVVVVIIIISWMVMVNLKSIFGLWWSVVKVLFRSILKVSG